MSTKEQILSLGEMLITSKGFNAFSYQDISTALGIKNAAVHYHYPTKTDLGVDVLERSRARFKSAFEEMDEKGLSYAEKLDSFIGTYIQKQSGKQICIVAATGGDYPTLAPQMQQSLNLMMNEILTWLTDLLEKGKKGGVFHFESNAETKALMLITNLASGLVLSRVLGDEKLQEIIAEIKRDLQVDD